MKIIHIQTTVQSVFGKVDEDGNVVEKYPINVEVAKLDESSFAEVNKKLQEVRTKLKEG